MTASAVRRAHVSLPPAGAVPAAWRDADSVTRTGAATRRAISSTRFVHAAASATSPLRSHAAPMWVTNGTPGVALLIRMLSVAVVFHSTPGPTTTPQPRLPPSFFERLPCPHPAGALVEVHAGFVVVRDADADVDAKRRAGAGAVDDAVRAVEAIEDAAGVQRDAFRLGRPSRRPSVPRRVAQLEHQPDRARWPARATSRSSATPPACRRATSRCRRSRGSCRPSRSPRLRRCRGGSRRPCTSR